MADKEIPDLDPATLPLDGTELHHVVQGGDSLKVVGSEIVKIAHNQAWSTITSTPTTLSGYGITDAASSTQGDKADTALQPGDIGDTVQAQGTFLDELSALTAGSDGQVIGWSSGALATFNAAGGGDMLSSNNLSDVASAATARTNLGLATVAATGDYSDLSGLPTLGSAAAEDSSSFATAAEGALAASALQAASNFSDVASKPTSRLNLIVPTYVSDLTMLAGLDTAKDAVAHVIVAGGRNGVFVWNSSDLSASVTADTEQGIYVPPSSDTSGASGAWVRQAAWHVAGLDPLWFGADDTGASDSSTSIAAAFDFAALNGGHVHFGPGRFVFDSVITKTFAKSLKISGSGRGVTALVADNADGLFDLTSSSQGAYFEFSHASMTSTQAGAGTALSLTYPSVASSSFPTVDIHDFDIGGDDILSNAFENGIVLSNCWNVAIDHFVISGGRGASYTRLMSKAIKGSNCVGIGISNFWIFYCAYGYYCGDTDTVDEGFHMWDGEMVDVDTGIYHHTTVAHAGTAIHDIHVNARVCCIDLSAKQQIAIHGCLLYHINDDANDWIGIKLVDNDKTIVFGNQILGGVGATGSENAIVINNSNYCKFIGNESSAFAVAGTMFILQGTSTANEFDNNKALSDSAAITIFAFTGTGTGNICRNNTPLYQQTLTANSATPSVGNAEHDDWETANTAATTITNFTNSYFGQKVRILANDANTTIQHNAGLLLKSGTSVTLATGNVLTLQRYSGAWREVSRNF